MCRSARGLTNHVSRLHGDIDEVVVQRLIAGERCAEATDTEKRAAGLLLSGKGWSLNEIAAQLGVTARTVCRWRASQSRNRSLVGPETHR